MYIAPHIFIISNSWRLIGQLDTLADLHPRNEKVPNEHEAGQDLEIVWMVLEEDRISCPHLDSNPAVPSLTPVAILIKLYKLLAS